MQTPYFALKNEIAAFKLKVAFIESTSYLLLEKNTPFFVDDYNEK